MKVLVTGIAGFIGSHLADRLAARGDEVVGLDDFDPFYERWRKEANVARLRGAATVLEGDILDAALVERLFAEHRFDAVVHLAALAGVRPSLAAPARYQRVNVEGTAIVADAALRRGVRRFVFASSSSVYGANTKVPFAETDVVDAPVSPYAASKRSAELVLRSLAHVHRVSPATGAPPDGSVTLLRYFTVYGPRQRPEMAVHAFCRAIDRGEPLRLFGAGDSSRDYTYVDDVVEGTLAAIDRALPGHRVYNLGGSVTTRLDALVAKIARALGRPARVEHAPAIPGDVPCTFADISAAARDLGYAPRVGIDEGIARFVEWYRAGAGERLTSSA
jgi:UDP-glucuronate 4-epimerase